MSKDYCLICKSKKECYTLRYSQGQVCLECLLKDNSWWYYRVIKADRKKVKKLLKQRKQEREEVELEEEFELMGGDKYDDFYIQFENITRIKEKERYCKFCNKRKMTRFKIHESESHGGGTHAICLSPCLSFIAGMDNQAKWGRLSPPE